MESVREWFQKRGETVIVCLLFLAITTLSLYLPVFVSSRHLASPDETANLAIIQQAQWGRGAFIEDKAVLSQPWITPRSWVAVGEGIRPVGFLGVAALILPFFRLIPALSPAFFASLLILSAFLPLYGLLKRSFGWKAASLGVLAIFTFPTWIYYTNRSLFPNALQLSLFAWSLFVAVWPRLNIRTRNVLFGLLMGVTTAIRPYELMWLLPWWMWWMWREELFRYWMYVVTGFVLGVLPAFVLGWMTYGQPFSFGYWQTPNVMQIDSSVSSTAQTSRSILLKLFPYGIHPRVMWHNVISFSRVMMWPWVVAVMILIVGMRRKLLAKQQWIVFGLIAYTLMVLLVVYGSGLYQDHIRPDAITVGNSFLRYLLPVTLLFGWLVAWASASFALRWQKMALTCFVLVLAGVGIYTAFVKDDESLFAVGRELRRYDTIAEQAKTWFEPQDLIISPRSDKVFFPEFRVASPLPSRAVLVAFLRDSHQTIGYFDRTLEADQQAEWQRLGIKVEWLQTFGNESLYRFSFHP